MDHTFWGGLLLGGAMGGIVALVADLVLTHRILRSLLDLMAEISSLHAKRREEWQKFKDMAVAAVEKESQAER